MAILTLNVCVVVTLSYVTCEKKLFFFQKFGKRLKILSIFKKTYFLFRNITSPLHSNPFFFSLSSPDQRCFLFTKKEQYRKCTLTSLAVFSYYNFFTEY